VRQERAARAARAGHALALSGAPNPALPVAPSLHTVEEQQVALNMTQFAAGGGDGVNQLVRAMVVSTFLERIRLGLHN
jgi:hypothetical protein